MSGDAVVPLWGLYVLIILSVLAVVLFILLLKMNAKRRFGADKAQEAEEEILSIMDKVHGQGNAMSAEARMIKNIFDFDDKDAKDIMTHRSDIFAISTDVTLSETIEIFNDSHFSRVPVYMEDLDNIIGIIHIREVLRFGANPSQLNKKLRDLDGIMQKANFIPETHSINTLFTQMQHKKMHLMIVKDEYGQTSGLITMEDILEEIVGNIQDEHDDEKESIVEVGTDRYVMFGRTEISDVEEMLRITFEEDVETLNGFMTMRYGRIPEEGERFKINKYGYVFEALDVKARIIQQVRVHKIKIPDILEERNNP